MATPWTAAHQTSLSITNSQSLLKLMSIESVIPSNHLILCRPLLVPPSIFWPPDEKNWLTGKDPDTGKNWRQEEKGTTEDEMVGWHHRLNRQCLGKLRGSVMAREAWRSAVHCVAKGQIWLIYWTELWIMEQSDFWGLRITLSSLKELWVCELI